MIATLRNLEALIIADALESALESLAARPAPAGPCGHPGCDAYSACFELPC